MQYKFSVPSLVTMRGTLAAVSLAAASVSSWALPPFTLSPSGAGLNGANFIVSDFSTTLFTSPTTFAEQGYLAIRTIEIGDDVAVGFGPSTGYGLYISFNATGTLTSPTAGRFDTLTYTLYGYNGTSARFRFSGVLTTVTTAQPAVALATGALLSGTVETSPSGAPSASAVVTFTPTALGAGFFTSPMPFYTSAETSFINTLSQVTQIPGGFRIRQGGGSFNFIPAVPEPETYAMLLAGLAAVGFVANRRKR